MGVFVVAYSVSAFFAFLFQCVPIAAGWDLNIKGRCINLSLAFTIVGAINVITDAVILAMPLPQLWRLNTTTARKAQLVGMFLTGGLWVTLLHEPLLLFLLHSRPADPRQQTHTESRSSASFASPTSKRSASLTQPGPLSTQRSGLRPKSAPRSSAPVYPPCVRSSWARTRSRASTGRAAPAAPAGSKAGRCPTSSFR
jgi:hypothetical protein